MSAFVDTVIRDEVVRSINEYVDPVVLLFLIMIKGIKNYGVSIAY